MGLAQKWHDMPYRIKKRIILCTVLTIILGIVGYFSVRAIIRYDPYAKYTEIRYDSDGKLQQIENRIERQDFVLSIGESVDFDLDWQLRNIDNINIKKIDTITPSSLSCKNNKITALQPGLSDLKITVYDAVNLEKYTLTVARVYADYIGKLNPTHAIEVRTVQDLVDINENLSASYVLKSNIDLADFGEWILIGDFGKPFTGSFVNSGEFKIKNLRITSSLNTAGLFHNLDSGAFLDGLILENIFIDTSSYNHSIAGGIAGFSDSPSIIRNCTVQGTIIADDNAAGIVSAASDATISGCVFIGSVKSINSFAGGIIGRADDGFDGIVVVNCMAGWEIDSLYFAGGIIGYIHGGVTQYGIIKDNRFVGKLLNAKNKGEICGSAPSATNE